MLSLWSQLVLYNPHLLEVALGRLHQDDGEGERRGCATGKSFGLKFVTVKW
jgi:hypothetical protein